MHSPSLVEVTRDKLNNRRRTLRLREIAAATGISEHFLSRFGRNEMQMPDAKRVQLLYEYLTDEPLIKSAETTDGT